MNLINVTVSHELRNPLNSIFLQNYSNERHYKELKSILEEDVVGPNEITSLSKIVAKLWDGKTLLFSSTNMMKNLMDDLIDYS